MQRRANNFPVYDLFIVFFCIRVAGLGRRRLMRGGGDLVRGVLFSKS